MIRLGPFDLYAPIGKGGTSEIWSAVHVEQELPVAVKFLTARKSRNEGFRAVFRNEVRSMASLDHPHIVMVFDYGEVSPRVAAMSEGRLLAGTPYLAMELVRGGTLDQLRGKLRWSELQDVMLSLLDALAHAHARNVIHRDIKPGNVLLFHPAEGQAVQRRWVKLADFGLAHALGEDLEQDDLRTLAGTPAYMAPEQIAGRTDTIGPWTDLYSFGCLVYDLVSGRPPFGLTPADARRQTAHLTDPVPPLKPLVPVPPGFEDWLLGLLAKRPEQRYRRAADAAWALLQLGGPKEEFEPRELEPLSEDDLVTLTATAFLTQLDLDDMPAEVTDAGLRPVEAQVPPFPPTWRRPEPPRPSMQLVGAGLGVYGMRQIPLIDRDDERDALWDALGAVRAQRRMRVVVLEGPSGCGLSRIAEWLCERGHETGAASVFRVRHDAVPSPGQGLSGALRSFFSVSGADRAEALAQVELRMRRLGLEDAGDWTAMAEWVGPARAADAMVQFTSQAERFVVVRHLLERLADRRPLVVWLDDLHWGLESIEFVRYLLDSGPLAVLVVATVSADGRAERRPEASALEGLADHRATSLLRVAGLPPEERAAFVKSLLPLEPPLARRVEETTQGNCTFAVQLVGDWVQRAHLEPGRDGFRLRSGVAVEIPDDLHVVWMRRIERVLEGRPLDETRALEIAAILGTDVSGEEWRHVCSLVGATPSASLVDALLRQNLARTEDGTPRAGWSFAHAMVRDSVERMARTAGRDQDHHRACATYLAAQGGQDQERLGRHWLAAGEPRAALRPLVVGIQRCVDQGDYARAELLLEARERALDLLGHADDSSERAQHWLLRAEIAVRRGTWEEADTWLDRVEAGLALHGWRSVRPRALMARGRRRMLDGEMGQALVLFEQALEALDPDEHALRGRLHHACAEALTYQGQVELADERAADALRAFDEAGDLVGRAGILRLLGENALALGDDLEAVRLLREAHAIFEERGVRWAAAAVLNSLGDVARYQGRLEVAEQLYSQAAHHWHHLGAEVPAVRHNLALVALERGRPDVASDIYAELVPVLVSRGDHLLLPDALLGWAACAALEGAWDEWDDRVQRAKDLQAPTAVVDDDTARLLLLLGAIAKEAGERDRARQVYEWAARLWRTLGRMDEVTAVDAALSSLR